MPSSERQSAEVSLASLAGRLNFLSVQPMRSFPSGSETLRPRQLRIPLVWMHAELDRCSWVRVEKVKGKAPSDQVAAVISTTINNAVTYPSRSILYCTLNPCRFAKITPVLTWTMSTIQNLKGSGSGFKLLRPRNEEPVRSNLNQDLNFDAKILLLPVPVPFPRITI